MSDMRVMKCPICSEPYETYAYYAGDQSACADCRRKAREKFKRQGELQ